MPILLITADTDDQIDFKVGGSDKFTMTTDTFTARNNVHLISASGTSDLRIQNSTTGSGSTDGLLIQATGSDVYINQYESAPIIFRTSNTDRMRLTSDGGLLHGKTSSGSSVQGIEMEPSNGALTVARTNNLPFLVNRISNDGDLIALRQDGTSEGYYIRIWLNSFIYGFTGTHWSRLADNSKPTILKGTILESLDEMMDWYQAVADVAESTDAEGNVTHAHKVKESIALGSKSVGDSITFTSNGVE